MNKILMILVTIAVVGAGAFFVVQQSDSDSNDSKTESTEPANDITPTEFAPVSTEGLSFVATMKGTGEGSQIDGSFESDGKGNVYFKGALGGETVEYYILSDGTYIVCQGETCFKTPNSADGPSLDDIAINESSINEIKSSATFSGIESCESGSCEVWTSNEDGTDAKVYIDRSTKRVTKVSGTEAGDEFSITYDYKDVTITAPENVQELPSIGQ